jgi:hypothetical protein
LRGVPNEATEEEFRREEWTVFFKQAQHTNGEVAVEKGVLW